MTEDQQESPPQDLPETAVASAPAAVALEDQPDIKIDGITEEIMKVALEQAKAGRAHILGEMSKALTEARTDLGEYAPRTEVINIPVDKIREVIGTGGKVIREIVEKTGAKIDISDDGTVKVASSDGKAITAALNWIKGIAAEPEERLAGIESGVRAEVRGGVHGELPERDREVISARYGIGDQEPQTLDQIGRRLGISRERVRQIERSALERLARARESETLRDLAA